MGVPDFDGVLEPNQIFIQYSDLTSPEDISKRQIAKGKVVIAKNPCLWPGDIQICQAVDAPHLCNSHYDVVVFSTKGERPVANMCSGSDLDGDLYSVIWDLTIVNSINTQLPPLDYKAPSVVNNNINGILHFEIAKQMVRILENSKALGQIARQHLALADQNGASSLECNRMAIEFSKAVDYPKSGVPGNASAEIEQWPDFMEKEPSYESQRTLGLLYRSSAVILPFTLSELQASETETQDSHADDPKFKMLMRQIAGLKAVYDEQITQLMTTYGIKTEAELFTGCFSNTSMQQSSPSLKLRTLAVQLKIQLTELQQIHREQFFRTIGQFTLGVNCNTAPGTGSWEQWARGPNGDEILQVAKAVATCSIKSNMNTESDEAQGGDGGQSGVETLNVFIKASPHMLSYKWVVYSDLIEPKTPEKCASVDLFV